MYVRLFPMTLVLSLVAHVQAETLTETGAHAMHGEHHPASSTRSVPREPGQSGFAAIQEVVGLLQADPTTDWRQVDVERLRQHLIDMDRVTLHAEVRTEMTDTGIRFRVASENPDVAESIKRMVAGHLRTLTGAVADRHGMRTIDTGVVLTLSTDNYQERERWNALGFIGWLTDGMHHQSHHLALAKGLNPH